MNLWAAVATASGLLGQPIELASPDAEPGTLRVRVREVELLAPAGAPPGSAAGTSDEIGERVVFTDLIELADRG